MTNFIAFLNNVPIGIMTIALFVAVFVFHEIGVTISTRHKRLKREGGAEGIGPLEGSLLGLLALLLSFTLNLAALRFDDRRNIITHEATQIGSAIALADMYPDSLRTELRGEFRNYLEARIAYYEAGSNEVEIARWLNEASTIVGRIWKIIADYSKEYRATIPHSLMIPTVDDMDDTILIRDVKRHGTVPPSIIWLLIALTLLCSFILGYSKKETKNDWIALTIYSLMTVLTIYTIIDMDRPRRGLIKAAFENEKIKELRNIFKGD